MLQPDIQLDIWLDISPDIWLDFRLDIQLGYPRRISGGIIQPDIQPDYQANIWPDSWLDYLTREKFQKMCILDCYIRIWKQGSLPQKLP